MSFAILHSPAARAAGRSWARHMTRVQLGAAGRATYRAAGRSKTSLSAAPEPICLEMKCSLLNRSHFALGSTLHLLHRSRFAIESTCFLLHRSTLNRKPRCAPKQLLFGEGVRKHLLLTALETNPLSEVPFEITFR